MDKNRAGRRVFLFAFLVIGSLPSGCHGSPESEPPDLQSRTVRFSLVGKGDPRSQLPAIFPALTLALHEGISQPELADALGVDSDDLTEELERLEDLGLVARGPDGFRPGFFVADRRESEMALLHAKASGRLLAEETLHHWDLLERAFDSMAISTAYSLKDLGFFLVGGRILDAGILEALVVSGQVPEPAPSHRGPPPSKAPYYLWAVEGDRDHLGRYGETSVDLPRGSWRLVTFGQTRAGEESQEPRDIMEKQIRDLVREREDGTPLYFSQALSVPILTERDSRIWNEVSRQLSAALLHRVREKGPNIPRFFRSMKSSRYTDSTFGEFLFWYHHLALASAIDELVREAAFNLPEEGFQSAIFYAEERNELARAFE